MLLGGFDRSFVCSRDLRPDNLLVALDGNLQLTYHGKWHNSGRPKDVVEGYSAPGEIG